MMWSLSPVFKSSPEVVSQLTQFRAWAASAEMQAEKYAAAPSAIDFSSAKSKIRDAALVGKLESFYTNAISSGLIKPEVHEWPEEDKAMRLAQIEDAKKTVAETNEMIAKAEEEMAFLQSNKTTRDTSAGDWKKIYPEIADEVEQELVDREWFKDNIVKTAADIDEDYIAAEVKKEHPSISDEDLEKVVASVKSMMPKM